MEWDRREVSDAPLLGLVYRHSNQISVVIEPGRFWVRVRDTHKVRTELRLASRSCRSQTPSMSQRATWGCWRHFCSEKLPSS